MALRISTSRFIRLVKPPICLIFSTHFFSSKSQIRISDYLINQHQFSPEIALKVSLTLPYVKTSENPEAILSFLKDFGFSKSHIEKVLKSFPRVLCSNIDKTIQPKIKIFQELGFSPTDISEIISRNPCLIFRSVNNQLAPSILVLNRIMGSHVRVCSLLKKSTWVLNRNLEKIMVPNIELVKSCGISTTEIGKYLLQFPRFFMFNPETMKSFVEKVDEMGFDRKSKMFLHAIRIVSSMRTENWKRKLQHFQSLGFSKDDILCVFQKFPQAFAPSEDKLTKIIQVLLRTGEIDISSLVKHPVLLTLSIESRLKPRLKVLEILERKNLLKKKPTLTTVFQFSKKKFLDRYVLPYSNELSRFDEADVGSSNLLKYLLN